MLLVPPRSASGQSCCPDQVGTAGWWYRPIATTRLSYALLVALPCTSTWTSRSLRCASQEARATDVSRWRKGASSKCETARERYERTCVCEGNRGVSGGKGKLGKVTVDRRRVSELATRSREEGEGRAHWSGRAGWCAAQGTTASLEESRRREADRQEPCARLRSQPAAQLEKASEEGRTRCRRRPRAAPTARSSTLAVPPRAGRGAQ